MKNKLRFLCFALALMLIMPLIISCSDNGGSGDPSDTLPDVETTPPEDLYDANGFLKDGIDDEEVRTLISGTSSVKNNTITIFRWTDREFEEYFVTQETGEPVNDAIWRRNSAVEERLGIKFEFIGTNGNSGNREPFTTAVSNDIQSGSHSFDIISVYSLTAVLMAGRGLLYALTGTAYIDFEKPWWPDSLISEGTINGKLYYASGDISANTLYMMYAMFFNKNLIEDFKLENPHDLVASGKWTLDKLMEMCNSIYGDLNGNNQKDRDDRYGFATTELYAEGFTYSTGNKILDKDKDGNFVLGSVFGEKYISLIEKLNNFFWNTNDAYLEKGTQWHNPAFNAGRVLFFIDRAHRAITDLQTDNLSYGVIPGPKWDENQERYITCMGNPFSFYSIPTDSLHPDVAAAVMETFASESYRRVTPALFEITLKIKRVDDQVSAQMYDLIKENITFDFGRLLSSQLIAQADIRAPITNNASNWASTVASRTPQLLTNLENVMKNFN